MDYNDMNAFTWMTLLPFHHSITTYVINFSNPISFESSCYESFFVECTQLDLETFKALRERSEECGQFSKPRKELNQKLKLLSPFNYSITTLL